MTDRLRGKKAVITAAGQGIGRAIAEVFLREGAQVWATDLDVAKLDGLDGAERRKLDVLSNGGVEALARESGPVPSACQRLSKPTEAFLKRLSSSARALRPS